MVPVPALHRDGLHPSSCPKATESARQTPRNNAPPRQFVSPSEKEGDDEQLVEGQRDVELLHAVGGLEVVHGQEAEGPNFLYILIFAASFSA
jgi:hypothetical protein